MKKYSISVVMLLLLLVGCSGGGEVAFVTNMVETATSMPIKTAVSPTKTPIPPATAEAEAIVETIVADDPASVPSIEGDDLGETVTTTVTIIASDGLPLQATYYAPVSNSVRPAVILLHMLNSNRQAWLPTGLPQELVGNGRYHVLTLDMRGHGETGGTKDWSLAEEDFQLVWQWLVEQPGVDGEKTAVVGGSIGANMALRVGANSTAINTVVLLSPGLDYRGVTTADALVGWGKRPLLIIASEEDRYAADSSQALAEQAQGEVALQLYQSAGHGTNIFNAEPELVTLIVDWLADHY